MEFGPKLSKNAVLIRVYRLRVVFKMCEMLLAEDWSVISSWRKEYETVTEKWASQIVVPYTFTNTYRWWRDAQLLLTQIMLWLFNMTNAEISNFMLTHGIDKQLLSAIQLHSP